jgi:CheY-like chemotaxis protein
VFEEGTILIVDDVASNRGVLKEFLQHTALSVIETEDGSQALHVLQTSCPADMILLDLKMPVMTGYDVIKRIRSIEELRQTPVVALTATTLKPDKDIGISRGFDGYLQKPVGRTELLREIARFLPHTLHSTPSNQSNVEEPANNAASAPLLENTPEDLSGLIELLENDCFTQWQSARKSGSFEEIEAFGIHLQQLGEQYALHRLQELGSTLVAQVRNFDVEHISATLEAYPAVVEGVKLL